MPAIPVYMAVAVKIYVVDFPVTARQRSRETGVKEVSSGAFLFYSLVNLISKLFRERTFFGGLLFVLQMCNAKHKGSSLYLW